MNCSRLAHNSKVNKIVVFKEKFVSQRSSVSKSCAQCVLNEVTNYKFVLKMYLNQGNTLVNRAHNSLKIR